MLTLARLLSPAVRVDAWLLRECRLTLAPQLDVGVEADLWFSDIVASRGPSGFVSIRLSRTRCATSCGSRTISWCSQVASLVAHAHEGHPGRF